MHKKVKDIVPGLLLSACVAVISILLNSLIPGDIIGATVIALLVGMALNPIVSRFDLFN